MWRTTYEDIVHTTKDIEQWEHTTHERVFPPCAIRQLGRLLKNRI